MLAPVGEPDLRHLRLERGTVGVTVYSRRPNKRPGTEALPDRPQGRSHGGYSILPYPGRRLRGCLLRPRVGAGPRTGGAQGRGGGAQGRGGGAQGAGAARKGAGEPRFRGRITFPGVSPRAVSLRAVGATSRGARGPQSSVRGACNWLRRRSRCRGTSEKRSAKSFHLLRGGLI
ncbi:unnamed protein product [Rangifer tarandus platyrhynchus]|uniref:Uncharacterized protein n=1 Tax=Rangifer tarandus platyrhynchus TaxID=3082113 RepID=A0ABN8XX12_RANTA|nr:unnamed protein product [Rangifer tarandus platyrhynchus]